MPLSEPSVENPPNRRGLAAAALLALALCPSSLAAAQAPSLSGAPQLQPLPKPSNPCLVKRAGAAVSSQAVTAAAQAAGLPRPAASSARPEVQQVLCDAVGPLVNWYARFLSGPQVKPMTPREKAWLAVRNVGDPFNAATILASSAIAVGANAHSPYGPGMTGFGKYVGVSYTQDMTGEFFSTFLIPTLAHQDPHYHRMPQASIPRRIAHTVIQVAWTQGDNGRGMINYADLAGFALDDAVGNLYVPARRTNLPSSAARYGTALAIAPTDNLITEFLPDLARRIHVRVVFVQRIVNQVARSDAAQ